MIKLEISPQFTIEDIHRIREYNYEMTKDLPWEEQMEYYRAGAAEAKTRIAKCRAEYLAQKATMGSK